MSVYYRCKICEEEHPASIPCDDERAFESSTLMTISLKCPKIKESAVYDKEDMFWKDEEEP
jgi:hypothetical protein